jgi:hypothetical protein
MEAPDGWIVQIKPPTRSLDANAAMWLVLDAFSKQLQWPVNGVLEWLTPEEWKDLLSAAFKRETVRVAMGLDGGMVMLGLRTSKLPKAVFSEMLEFMHATAVQRGVVVYKD